MPRRQSSGGNSPTTTPRGRFRRKSTKDFRGRGSLKGLSPEEEDRLSSLDQSIEELQSTIQRKKRVRGKRKVSIEGVPLLSSDVPAADDNSLEAASPTTEKSPPSPTGLPPTHPIIPEAPTPTKTEQFVHDNFAGDGQLVKFDSVITTPINDNPSPVSSEGSMAQSRASIKLDDKEMLWMELLRRKDEQLTLVLKREKIAVDRMRQRIKDLELKTKLPTDADGDTDSLETRVRKLQDATLQNLQAGQQKLMDDYRKSRENTLEMKMFAAQNAIENQTIEADAAPTGEVTLVFTDVQSSTHLWDQATTDMMSALQIHNDLLRKLINAHHGYEVKTEGDAFMVAFSYVKDAVAWAHDVQTKLLEQQWPDKIYTFDCANQVQSSSGSHLWSGLRVRVGIHVGKPTCTPDPLTHRMDYFGPMVNTGARVAGCAHGGEIICSDEVFEQIKSFSSLQNLNVQFHNLGEKNFKGVSTAVVCHRVVPASLTDRKFPKPEPPKTEIARTPTNNADGKGQDSQGSRLDETATFLQWVVREEQKRDEEPPQGEVALVFTDVQSSTHLWDTKTQEMSQSLNLHNSVMRHLIQQHNGYEVKTEGDAFMVAFSSSENAVEFVAEAQVRLLQVRWPAGILQDPAAQTEHDTFNKVIWNGLRVRCGVHLGKPVSARDPITKRMDYFGPMVNLAARVGGCANGGEIVISKSVYDANCRVGTFSRNSLEVTSLGPKQFKGVTASVDCYRMMPMRLRGRVFPVAAAPLPEPSIPRPFTGVEVDESSFMNMAKGPNTVSISHKVLSRLCENWTDIIDLLDRTSDGQARNYKEIKERKEVLQGRRMSKAIESPSRGRNSLKNRRQSVLPPPQRRKSMAPGITPAPMPMETEKKEKKDPDEDDVKTVVRELENVSMFFQAQGEPKLKAAFQEKEEKYVVAFGSTVPASPAPRRARQPSKGQDDLCSPKGGAARSPQDDGQSTPSTPASGLSPSGGGLSTPSYANYGFGHSGLSTPTTAALPAPAIPVAARPPLASPRPTKGILNEVEDSISERRQSDDDRRPGIRRASDIDPKYLLAEKRSSDSDAGDFFTFGSRSVNSNQDYGRPAPPAKRHGSGSSVGSTRIGSGEGSMLLPSPPMSSPTPDRVARTASVGLGTVIKARQIASDLRRRISRPKASSARPTRSVSTPQGILLPTVPGEHSAVRDQAFNQLGRDQDELRALAQELNT